jgi:hypothetical protein
MTDSERQKILEMIEAGKITPQDGLILMQTLETTPLELAAADQTQETPGPESTESAAEKERREAFFAGKLKRFRRLWLIPLFFSLLLTVGAAYWMFLQLQHSGLGFGFLFPALLLALGVLTLTLAAASRDARWLYLNVLQKPGETPRRIVIAFPMTLVTGLVNLTGGLAPGFERERMKMVMEAFTQSISLDEPVLIEVHDDDGEEVQIYIG